jgi:uncharacterized repeat protein (TIGR03803 family)
MAFLSFSASPLAAQSYQIKVLANFNNTNGAQPEGGLITDGNGNLYGVASTGGANNDGVIFKYSQSGGLQTLASFSYSGGSGEDGPWPSGILTPDGAGGFYGRTEDGGAYGDGNIFHYTASGGIVDVADFQDSVWGGTTGEGPAGYLLADGAGNYYGVTEDDAGSGTSAGSGTIFEFTPTSGTSGTIQTPASFNGTNGSEPYAGLITDGKGNFYGTTRYGGNGYVSGNDQTGYGTVFCYSASTRTISLIAAFNGTNGSQPRGALLSDGAGDFYGTTSEGGAYGLGTIFKCSLSGVITTVASFNGANGAYPICGLVVENGNLFGTTAAGGSFGVGTVFEYSASGGLRALASFNGANGAFPLTGLAMDGSGNLYGTTIWGGPGSSGTTQPGYGTIFELVRVPPACARAWGGNGAGADGELGAGSPGTTLSSGATPTRVKASPGGDAFTDVTQTASGYTHTLALRADGTIWAWGTNTSGELGNDTTTSTTLPVQVLNSSGTGPLENVLMVAAGNHFSMAVVGTASGETIYTWGANGSGQLGNGTTTSSPLPVVAYTAGANTILSIACGSAHALACTNAGVYAWGDNTHGQLGVGSAGGTHYTPQLVLSQANYYGSVAAGAYCSVATGVGITWTGSKVTAVSYSVSLAGADDRGQMADGGGADVTSWKQLAQGVPLSVACGQNFCLGYVTSTGALYAWGDNTYGQLGTGTTGGIVKPTAVTAPTTNAIVQVTAGNGFTLLLDSAGNVWSAGTNSLGQLGTGGTTPSSSATFAQVSNLPGVSQISAGAGFSTALSNDFKFVWNDISNGALPVWDFANPFDNLLNTAEVSITGSNPYTSYKLVTTVDLFGDGNRDLLLQNLTTGALAYIRLNGTSVASSGLIPAAPTYSPSELVVGTMNINNKPALVWQNTSTGEVDYWTMGLSSGTPVCTGGGKIAAPGNYNWQVAAAFPSGGSNWIIWHNITSGSQSGQVVYQQVTTSGVYGSQAGYCCSFAVPVGWTLHMEDVNGDGYPDFIWHDLNGSSDAASGHTSIWLGAGPDPSYGSSVAVSGILPSQVAIPIAYFIGGIL